MGNEAVMKAGDVQRISAGTGVLHSEFNYSPIDPVHFLQIWIVPDHKGAKPDYAEKSFTNAPKVCSIWSLPGPAATVPSLSIRMPTFTSAKLTEGNVVTPLIRSDRHAWIHLAEGEAIVNGEQLKAGDALALSEETTVKIEATKPSQVLVFDLN